MKIEFLAIGYGRISAVGPHEDLLTIVKRRKLQWYGHIFYSLGLAKNHLARRSERRKKTRHTEEEVGRQHQEWTGLKFAKSKREVEYREK